MDSWRGYTPTGTKGAEDAEAKAREACQAALEAEKHCALAHQASEDGLVDVAQQHAHAAQEHASRAQVARQATDKASIAHSHANPIVFARGGSK